MKLLVGHKQEYNFLRTSLQGHAFLLAGPCGVGKSALVERVIAVRYCQQTNHGDPCGICVDCKQVATHSHQDLCWISRADDKKDISIDQVRSIKAFTNLISFSSNPRCVVVERADEMSGEAAHALLKVLEEPGPEVIFYLTCTRAKTLLPTIQSRVVSVYLGLVPTDIIVKALQDEGLIINDLESIVSLAAGRPGIAFFLIKHPELVAQYIESSHMLIELLNGRGWQSCSSYIDNLTKEKSKLSSSQLVIDPNTVVSVWLDTMRDIMNLRFSSSAEVHYQMFKNELQLLADELSPVDIKRIIQTLVGGFARLRQNAHVRLTMEHLALQCLNI